MHHDFAEACQFQRQASGCASVRRGVPDRLMRRVPEGQLWLSLFHPFCRRAARCASVCKASAGVVHLSTGCGSRIVTRSSPPTVCADCGQYGGQWGPLAVSCTTGPSFSFEVPSSHRWRSFDSLKPSKQLASGGRSTDRFSLEGVDFTECSACPWGTIHGACVTWSSELRRCGRDLGESRPISPPQRRCLHIAC